MGNEADEIANDESSDTIQTSNEIRLYRVVRFNPPNLDDFTSPHEQGRNLQNPTPERQRLWRGLSCYATEVQARNKARKVPALGAFIVRLSIPLQSGILVERTGGSTGHHTI